MKGKAKKQQLEQVGSMKFLSLSFRMFKYEGRCWVPLADLARGLGYSRSTKLQDTVKKNPRLFREQSWILDGRSGISEGLIDTPEVSISAPGSTRDLSLFASVEGVIMCLMLNRSEHADEFKIWAAKRLVPGMMRRTFKQTPLDDLSPAERTRELIRRSNARLLREVKRLAAPWTLIELIRECRRLKAEGHPNDQIEPLVKRAGKMLERIDKAFNGPNLFDLIEREVSDN
ncbi:MAG: hypothetical protein M5U26_08335 [Planctomycetota bacterium]|nr:hypothetical protein [Planctomycetota bacterium]